MNREFFKLKTLCLCLRLSFICVLVILMTGCECVEKYSLTSHVWKFKNFREPAFNPKTEVFEDAGHKDFLIVYNEVHEGSEVSKRRAFFLGSNVLRLANREKPLFVNPQLTNNLPSIPVNAETNRLPFAIVGKNLVIHTDIGIIGPYDLPTYESKSGPTTRALLTPFALIGDAAVGAVMVGAWVGLWIGYGGGSFTL